MKRPWLEWSTLKAIGYLVGFVLIFWFTYFKLQEFRDDRPAYVASLIVLDAMGIVYLCIIFSALWSAAKRSRR